jgi:hypothetical protein
MATRATGRDRAAPPATHGYNRACRDAAAIRLDEDLEFMVAPLVDLIRIAEASDDRARLPALRRTLEVGSGPKTPLLDPEDWPDPAVFAVRDAV